MLAVGRLQGDLLGVALRGFAPQLSPSQQSLRHKVLDLLRAGGVSPPDFADLCRATAASPDVIRQLLDLAVFEGKAVRIREDLYLDAQVEAALRRRVTDEIRRSRGLTVSQIRDLLGTTRKFAVPICEHLDRIGLTRRHDDLRVLR
jgi:selenocysteine-specific elongation factor